MRSHRKTFKATSLLATARDRNDKRKRCQNTGKVIFNSLSDANYAACKIQQRTKTPWEGYSCAECGLWHVGHSRQRRAYYKYKGY